jgi:arginine decarboxylase
MSRPVSKVLVINDEPLILRDLLKGLNAAARSLDNPFGITFIGALTAKEGLALIERDGDVQSVIVDDKLYAVQDTRKRRNGTGEPARNLQVSALKLVQRITALRPELDIYILIEKEKEDQVVDALFAEAVDGYFYREERDYRGMYRILNAQVAERTRTPFTMR